MRPLMLAPEPSLFDNVNGDWEPKGLTAILTVNTRDNQSS